MKKNIFSLFVLSFLLTGYIKGASAELPLNNLEGVGGVAFNPVAYLSGKPAERYTSGNFLKNLSKPQIGAWYVHLDQVNVDWTAIGISETFFKRAELSYGHETIAPDGTNIHKNNVGGKVLLLQENWRDIKYLPAVSVGSIWKHTSNISNIDTTGYDYYLVATKFLDQLPKPILISGGVLSTKGRVTGVYGYDKDRDVVWFGNIDLLASSNLALGVEYKQGAKFSTFKNADYWDVHAAWLVNKNLTLVAAYVNAGDQRSLKKTGLGEGIVLSAQYQF